MKVKYRMKDTVTICNTKRGDYVLFRGMTNEEAESVSLPNWRNFLTAGNSYRVDRLDTDKNRVYLHIRVESCTTAYVPFQCCLKPGKDESKVEDEGC